MSFFKATWWRPASALIVLTLAVAALSAGGRGTAVAGFSAAQQRLYRRSALRVKHDTFFAAIPNPMPRMCAVAGAPWRLQLHNARAIIRQQHTRHGAGHAAIHFEDE